MSKWRFIALVSIALAGVFAVLAKRGTRSVEELKKDYAAACSEQGWMERLPYKWSRITGRRINIDASQERARKRIRKCEQALIKMGYLHERRYAVSNLPAVKVMHAAKNAWMEKFQTDPIRERVLGRSACVLFTDTNGVIASLRIEGGNAVVVVAPGEQISTWERIVRREDAR